MFDGYLDCLADRPKGRLQSLTFICIFSSKETLFHMTLADRPTGQHWSIYAYNLCLIF